MSGHSGGILELVARGKKDVFFTANPVVSFFHSVYMKAAPFTKELYVSKPRNVPEWGRWIDFDIEHRGDILRHMYLRVTLPSWLPPEADAINARGLVADPSGVTFGYTNRVGFHMLDKIQLFQDQVLIHETFGEYLDWKLRQSYSVDTTYIIGDSIGSHDDSPLGIARSLARRQLRIPIPLLGWQRLTDPGLPLTALRNTRLRLRIHLKRLDELIVASDGRLRPSPWDMPIQVQDTRNGPITTMRTLKQTDLSELDVSLEQTHLYIGPDVQTYLKAQILRIPYYHIQHKVQIVEDNHLTAAAVGGGTFHYNIPLDWIGSMDRMYIGFRSLASSLAGQRTQLRAADGSRFINSLRLNIANIDRIKPAPPALFREVTAYWKSRRMGGELTDPSKPQEVYTITFGGYDHGMPCGTLNFTRAVFPTLFCTLAAVPYDERNISRETYALLYGESWNIYEINNGRGRMMFES